MENVKSSHQINNQKEKKGMDKISIKNFVEGYSKCATQQLKNRYIKEKLEIVPYVPFVTKDALINNLLKITMFDKETGNVKVNSSAEYLLKTRIFIENYTNLTVETEGFYEEYDELKKSGLFDVLFIGNEITAPLIPIDEITEFNHLLDVKRNDVYTNHATPQAYINDKIERITTIGSITLKPILEKISNEIENLDDSKIDKITKALNRGLKIVK